MRQAELGAMLMPFVTAAQNAQLAAEAAKTAAQTAQAAVEAAIADASGGGRRLESLTNHRTLQAAKHLVEFNDTCKKDNLVLPEYAHDNVWNEFLAINLTNQLKPYMVDQFTQLQSQRQKMYKQMFSYKTQTACYEDEVQELFSKFDFHLVVYDESENFRDYDSD